ncbi:MAG: right-handed parallel beta-helix repeat-containing protein, partial [Gammaproteobacteria bacterium]|nr:right-handed parallel beta-helix repeat-containing protein [Gammaproteobacteria bacterium]
FIPAKNNQEPWGAIVLQGSGSNGSVLEHCEIRDGSGSKSDLFEYSGMLSIHDVQRVSISHCRLEDNHTVDDMVHAVYSEISFHDVHFKNALSDGLDLDISSAQISDSSFINSGNDGVDLMTTRAVITNSQFIRNGDKGISVGEGSQLHAANNLLANNTIGIQSKDGSRVFLSNETFRDNTIGLHAYKKNWQYGSGGKIFITKSAILNSKTTADAQKHSSIQVFDSFIEDTPKAKRVQFLQTDMASLAAARPSTLWPDPVGTDLAKLLEDSPDSFQQYIDPTKRGRRLHE